MNNLLQAEKDSFEEELRQINIGIELLRLRKQNLINDKKLNGEW